jgi:outer membrane receptor protein involved in Fe transport
MQIRKMKHLTKILTLVLVILITGSLRAQVKNRISGTIVNTQSKPVVLASVNLLRSDSSSIRIVSTNDKGYFEFVNLEAGKYIVKVTAVSFESYYSPAINLTDAGMIDLKAVQLFSTAVVMNSVTVEGSRAPIENKIDRMVVNVNATATNAGTNALEVLEKSPGVTVDREGNIFLKGRAGVTILIDGKPTYLSSTDLATMLKGMPASQLSQIEIMTQPPSQFDAAGNAGIINIKLAKNRQSGFNGSLNLSWSQGKYARFPNSLNFNYNKKKFNFYSSISYSRWNDFNDLKATRRFYDDNNFVTSVFSQHSRIKFKGDNFTVRTGVDYTLNKKTTIGFSLNGILNHNKADLKSNSNILDGKNQMDSIGYTTGYRDDKLKNFAANIYFEKYLDSTGRKFSTDADYVYYRNTSDQFYNNLVTYPDGSLYGSPLLLRAFLPSNISIYSFRAAYIHPLKNKAKFEAGVKSSLVKIDNRAPYETFDNSFDEWVTDPIRADHFRYRENINAAYINFNKEFKKWSFQTGLRYEATSSKGTQVLKNKSYPRDYGQLFPTLYVNYNVSKNDQLRLSYGRRLDRPNYQDMNPFQRFLDKYTYIQGNPFLRPQFTNNIELTNGFKNKLFTTLNYTFSNNIINDIFVQDDSTKVTFRTKGNIGKSNSIGISTYYYTSLTKWWSFNTYLTVYRNHYEGLLNNSPLDVNAWNFYGNLTSQFKISKTLGAEVTGQYTSRSLEGGIYRMEPRQVVSFAFSKQVMKDKGTLRLNIVDPFDLQFSHSKTRYDNIDVDILSNWDNRRINLSFTYRFKKGTNVKQQKNIQQLDEQRRVN